MIRLEGRSPASEAIKKGFVRAVRARLNGFLGLLISLERLPGEWVRPSGDARSLGTRA